MTENHEGFTNGELGFRLEVTINSSLLSGFSLSLHCKNVLSTSERQAEIVENAVASEFAALYDAVELNRTRSWISSEY